MPTFLVAAHTDPPMLARLVAALSPHPVVLHVDRKARRRPFERALSGVESSHVEWIEDRIRVDWADFSAVRATLRLMERGVEITDPDDHLCFLTGQDLALLPIDAIEARLAQHRGRQLIRGFDITAAGAWQAYGHHLTLRWMMGWALPVVLPPRLDFHQRNQLVRISRWRGRSAPAIDPGVRVLHGHANWAITARVAREVLALSPRLEPIFADAFAADEKFVHTAVGMLPRDLTGTDVEVPYDGFGQWRYTNLHFINERWSTLTEADLPALRATDRLFARKVDSRASRGLLDLIERETGTSG
jgi:hypothetical protein